MKNASALSFNVSHEQLKFPQVQTIEPFSHCVCMYRPDIVGLL